MSKKIVSSKTGTPREGHEREKEAAPGPLKDNGQHEEYWVLSDEERAKGFVRPVRRSYVHVGVRPEFETRELTDEEKELFDGMGYVAYESYPEDRLPTSGRFWTTEDLNSGCGAVTSMSRLIAETYASEPKFYGTTFCVGCKKHLPVEQFVWEGTDERVGS